MAYLHHGWTSDSGVFIVAEGYAPSIFNGHPYKKNAVRQTYTHWKCVIKTCNGRCTTVALCESGPDKKSRR